MVFGLLFRIRSRYDVEIPVVATEEPAAPTVLTNVLIAPPPNYEPMLVSYRNAVRDMTRDELEAQVRSLSLPTTEVEVGCTELLTADKMAKRSSPTVPIWMTVPDGPLRKFERDRMIIVKE